MRIHDLADGREMGLAMGLHSRLDPALEHPMVLDHELARHRALPLRHGMTMT
jgi:hypothetical protein